MYKHYLFDVALRAWLMECFLQVPVTKQFSFGPHWTPKNLNTLSALHILQQGLLDGGWSCYWLSFETMITDNDIPEEEELDRKYTQ